MDKSGRGSVEEQEPTCTKIYYASRTHSQLSQVLPELQKLKLAVRNLHPVGDDSTTSWGASRKRPLERGDENESESSCSRIVSLGSRKQLCINDQLRAVSRDLDESCREMLNGKCLPAALVRLLSVCTESDEKRCPYLPSTGDEERMLDFRDQILVCMSSLRTDHVILQSIQATPKDIEDLAEAGRISGVCPYFGSRRAIPQAEVPSFIGANRLALSQLLKASDITL